MYDDQFLAEGEDQYDGPIAIMRTFVLHSRVKVLSGLAALSFVAGREGRDEWAWAVEADDALIDAFFAKGGTWCGARYQRYSDVKAMLARAFRGGRAQREIDMAVAGRARSVIEDGGVPGQARDPVQVCERAIAVAHAHATIYAAEIEFPLDRHAENISRAVGYVATKVAQRHAVTEEEAAYCALKAFEERGFPITCEAPGWALDRAASGRADREAEEERARERAAEIEAATVGLFGVQE
jgi:hypothetical protein